jgi:hypothetical protein
MALALNRQRSKLASLNTRAEKHGADRTPAADLRLSMNCASAMLEHFGEGLRAFMFHKKGVGGDLVDKIAEAPDLRFPRFEYSYAGEMVGADVTIHFGTGGPSDITLGDCKVNKFTIAPQEGGTVIVGFRVQAHPDADQVGKLYSLIQREVEVTLQGPEFKDEGEADDDDPPADE